jgi:hypothetical protein
VSHVISVEAYDTGDGAVLTAVCSCGEELLSDRHWRQGAALADLNEIAHEHIEAAQRAYPVEPTSRERLTDESRGGDFSYG